jgi:Tfp pilus assembly PilM family ATPase/Tfp pilus assembly protein PilN
MILKQSKFIAVSLGSSVVKVAQVTRSGSVEKLTQKAVFDNAVEPALRDALRGFDTRKAGIICVLPGDIATTKYIEVPSVEREEIESIIALQASRHTPFNKDEIITSYVKIRSPRPNFTSILLVVVKRDAVKEKLTVMRSVGLDTTAVLFAPEGIVRFYVPLVKPKKGEKFALVDMASKNTNFIVVADGVPVMSRSIPGGIEDVVIDPAALRQVVQDVKASLDAFDQEGISRPSRIILTTDHAALTGMDKMLVEVTALPVQAMPYGAAVKGFKGFKEQLGKEFMDVSALDVIATGIAAAKCDADLVPQEIKDQRSVSEKGRETMKAGIFVLILLFFVGGGLLSRVYFKDLFLKQNLVAKYSEQKKEVVLLENMINKTRVLRDYLQARQLPLEAIRELYRIIPEEMYLSNISMDDLGNVTVQGVSESMSRVFSVVTLLEESPLFENVKTKSTTAKKDRGKDVAAFEIVLKLSVADVNDAAASKQGKQGAGLDQ